MSYSVRLEPIGVDMMVNDDETVLQAAFRQGITLMHGCKEGQCSSCKSVLLDGEAEHGDFSTFALSEFEQNDGKVLLCRLYAQSDLDSGARFHRHRHRYRQLDPRYPPLRSRAE